MDPIEKSSAAERRRQAVAARAEGKADPGDDRGWFCSLSSSGYCEYDDDLDHCIHCGKPEERK